MISGLLGQNFIKPLGQKQLRIDLVEQPEIWRQMTIKIAAGPKPRAMDRADLSRVDLGGKLLAYRSCKF